MVKSIEERIASANEKLLRYTRIVNGEATAREIVEESYRRKMITKEEFEDFLRIEKEYH